MFWGLILEPSKSYSQIVEKPFHISQAALDFSTGGSDPCQVMVSVDGKKFLICTLQKLKTVQVPLDLYFKSGEAITFVNNGKCNIHLTGYLDPEFEDELEVEEEEEDEEEAEVPVTNNKKRKAQANNLNYSKKTKIEAASSDSKSDEDNQLTKLLSGEDGEDDTDDADATYTANTSTEGDDSDEEEEEDSEEEEEDADDEDEVENKNDQKPKKSSDVSLSGSELDITNLTKSQRRRLKKLLSKQSEAKPQLNGNSNSSVTKKTKESKEEKKAEQKIKKKDEQQREKKTLAGGVQIEDLKVGDGAVAKSGKVVMVYYEGRLKQNNKHFDKCNKGPGFKFRLGAKEVISGWDIGVAGMKVGGVRKIVCPASMAYGAKGSPPVIPPNSSLLFEVELLNVK